MKYKVILVAIVIIALFIQGYVLLAVGQLVGLIALVETIKPLRWFIERTSHLIDVLIFILAIFASATLSLGMGASLIFAGIGFTLLYKPYLIARYKANKYNSEHDLI